MRYADGAGRNKSAQDIKHAIELGANSIWLTTDTSVVCPFPIPPILRLKRLEYSLGNGLHLCMEAHSEIPHHMINHSHAVLHRLYQGEKSSCSSGSG